MREHVKQQKECGLADIYVPLYSYHQQQKAVPIRQQEKKKRKINRKLCYVLLIWKRVNIAPLQSNTLLMKENIR